MILKTTGVRAGEKHQQLNEDQRVKLELLLLQLEFKRMKESTVTFGKGSDKNRYQLYI